MRTTVVAAGRAEIRLARERTWRQPFAIAVGCALALAGPARGVAQVSGDTARGAPRAADSLQRTAGDSGAPGQPGTAVPPGAAGAADRVPAASDPNAAPLPINVGPGAPPDTTLSRACAGMPGGTEAPGLLAAVFRPGTSDRDRVAAAKAVGGSLAGSNDYGEEYVRLAVGSGPLAAVADQLIRQDPVVRVSPALCPAQAVGPTAAPRSPADSARAPGGQPPGGQGPVGQAPAGDGAKAEGSTGLLPAAQGTMGEVPASSGATGQAPQPASP